MTTTTAAKTTKARAAEAEAKGTEHAYSWKSKKFVWPPRMEMVSLDALEAWEDNRMVQFVREILGAKQWGLFKSLSPTIADFNDLSEAMARSYGFDTDDTDDADEG